MFFQKLKSKLHQYRLIRYIYYALYNFCFRDKAFYKTVQTIAKNNNATCLEIGAFSDVFDAFGDVDIYKYIKTLDIANFSDQTVWKNNFPKNKIPKRYKMVGDYFIIDATDLKGIEDEKYDCVMTSNVLEHIANPIKALNEWKRVTKLGGYLLVVVPDKYFCFDHQRKDTNFEHILEDYLNNMKEDDLTHLDEILKYHDFTRDATELNPKSFRERGLDNINNRCLHHHVFNEEIFEKIANYISLKIIISKKYRGNIIILLQK